jgi:hypothetical protein
MEHIGFKRASFERDKLTLVNAEGAEFVFTPTSVLVNGVLIYSMPRMVADSDGYEYDYTIFDMV